jgi:hypothetical protein
MRTWVVAFALVLVACKGGKKKEAEKQAAVAKAALVGPKIDVDTVLAKDDKPPPFLFIVDDAGVRVAAAKTWADLDDPKLKITKQAPLEALDTLDKMSREYVGLGRDPAELVKEWENYDPGAVVDLAALEDIDTKNLAQDDPPPPEEEDKPDDGEESGGTGTAMALEEGKMGKKDADRAEGQYKMQKNQEDPQLARQQAIEQARAAGILGQASESVYGEYRASGGEYRASEDGTPVRVARVAGAIAPDSKLSRPRVMLLVPPTMKATKVAELLYETGGALAVQYMNKIRPLRIDFNARDGSMGGSNDWIEARVSAKGFVVEAVPDKAIEVADLKGIAAAIDEARKTRGTDANAPVDVLVDPDIDAQRLIDVLVALDVGGVRAIGIGPMPPQEELARRGKRMPRTMIGQPNSQGDLDKAEIRRVVKANLDKISACYTKALLENPGLSGTVAVQFFITPKGTVASASASGVDPAVADCVAAVVKALEFPKPKGGGGVQVNYPFTFRP